MKRQLFLHHYLTALYFGILSLGSAFELLTFKFKKVSWLIALVAAGSVIYVFFLFSPFAYGLEQPQAQCESLRWNPNWDFKCASLENPTPRTETKTTKMK